MPTRNQQALTLNTWTQVALLVAAGAFVGTLVATRFTLAVLFGVGILGLVCVVFAIQHYRMATNTLIFLSIALITLSIYAFPLPGGFDLQLNRAPLLVAVPFWLMAVLFPPYRPPKARFSWAFVWYMLLTAYALLSTVLLGDNPRTATSQLVALVFRGMLFIWLVQVVVSRRQLFLAGNALLAGGGIVVAFAVFQYVAWFSRWSMVGYSFVIPFGNVIGMRENTLASPGRIGSLFRLTLPFGSSSYLAPCIGALLLVAIGLWLYRSKRGGWRALVLVGYCLVMFVLLLGTYSRGAWIGFGVGLLVILLVEKRLWLKRRVWRVALLIVLILGLLMPLLLPFVGTVLGRFDLSLTQASDEAHRKFFLWAYEFFSSNPVWGIGWANYQARTGVLHAHNMYMTVLAEAGLIGLVLWLLFCAAIVCHGVRALRASQPESFLRYWNLGLLAAFVSILVDNLFQTTAYFGFLWVIAGLIVASHYVTVAEMKEISRSDLGTVD